MALNKLTKKITAIGTVGLLVATPFAFADNHSNVTNITGEIENTQDLETQVGNLNVSVKVEDDVEVEGVELTAEIQSTIDKLKASLKESQTEASFELKAEVKDSEADVEVETEGDLTEEQLSMITTLKSQIEELLSNVEDEAKVEIEIEAEIEVEEVDSDEKEDSENELEEKEETRIGDFETESEVKVEGVELTAEIQSTIDELKASLDNSTLDIEIEIEGEVEESEVDVEVETEGDLTEEQRQLVATLKTQLEELLSNVEGEAEVEIELESSVDDEDDVTDKAIQSSIGVQMRFAQLQAKLDARAENAQLVVNALADANISNEDLGKLENITAEFLALQEELNSIDAPTDATSFVAYKQQVIELSQEFKLTATPYITAEMREELQTQIKANQQEKIQERKDKIDELKKQYNARVVANNFGNVTGIDIEALTQQYINDEISLGELQSQVKTQIRGLNEEQRNDVKARVEERRNRADIEARVNIEDRKEQIQQRREQIQSQVEQRKNAIQEVVRAYATLPQEQKDRIRDSFENLSEDDKQRIRDQAKEVAQNIGIDANVRVDNTLGEVESNNTLRSNQ